MLAAYTFAYAQLDGIPRGIVTVALTIINFIFKKILLAMTDRIGIDSAMLVAGALPRPPAARYH